MRASNLTLPIALLAALGAWGVPANERPPGPGVTAFSLDRTDAQPVVAATRLVVFRWSDQVSFAVRGIASAFTNIEVPDGEVIEGFYVSAADAWSFHVTGDRRRVLVRPSGPGLYSTATLVTDQRSYEITLISVQPGEPWFQRVRWDVAAEGVIANGIFSADDSEGSDTPPSLDVPPEDLSFGYTIRGRADFAPVTVFDDGVRTWFRLGPSQDMPAIFAVTDGKIDVVDVARRGDFAVVARLSDEWRLKLHRETVTVRRDR